ncbi:hypothetical protein VR46_29850 [Streptomyces sp. NRRL S-444]|nr:hypothetical protein VR46_29850 [Streptomyces sp. NRRL S-444]
MADARGTTAAPAAAAARVLIKGHATFCLITTASNNLTADGITLSAIAPAGLGGQSVSVIWAGSPCAAALRALTIGCGGYFVMVEADHQIRLL